MSIPHYDAVIVGAGVQGLATLWQLARRGARVALVERFELAHGHGSSHGPTRIFRTAYPDPRYVRLACEAREHDWPELEAAAGERLLTPWPCCVFGPPDGLAPQYLAGIRAAGAAVETLDPRAARERFPALSLNEKALVLAEPDAAVIAAERTLYALARLARELGAELHAGERVLALETCATPLEVRTERRTLTAERVVLCTGGWTAALAPSLASRLVCLHQTIGYLRLTREQGALEPPGGPLWIRLGQGPNDIHYGLPTERADVVKVARHVTQPGGEPPGEGSGSAGTADDVPTAPDPEALAELEARAREIYRASVTERVAVDRCLYTSTQSEDFVLGPLATHASGRLLVATGFSGHGFKFAPLIGRALADLVTHGALQSAAARDLAQAWSP